MCCFFSLVVVGEDNYFQTVPAAVEYITGKPLTSVHDTGDYAVTTVSIWWQCVVEIV